MISRVTRVDLLVVLVASLAFAGPALAETIHVDGSTTIQQAVADAHQIPADHWVTILVEPGEYFGPIVVDRPRTRLFAKSLPVFRGGVLIGHNPAVVIRPPVDPVLGTLGVTANDVEIRGFDIDGGELFGISSYGLPYDQPGADELNHKISGVEISNNVITNAFGAIQIVQASTLVSGNTSVDAGHVGLVAGGGPIALGGTTVVCTGNVFKNKDFGANLFGTIDSINEFPRADGPPGSLTAVVNDNDWSGNTIGLILAFRGALPLSGEPGMVSAFIQGNRLGHSQIGLVIESQQCLFVGVCEPGAPGSSVDAVLIGNDLTKTVIPARFTFQLPTFDADGNRVDTGVYLQGSRIRLRTVRTPLGEFSYDNASGGNTLIVNGASYSGKR